MDSLTIEQDRAGIGFNCYGEETTVFTVWFEFLLLAFFG